jgi:hypothetical protein
VVAAPKRGKFLCSKTGETRPFQYRRRLIETAIFSYRHRIFTLPRIVCRCPKKNIFVIFP